MPTQTITSTQQPWANQIPYLQRGFNRAENLFQQGGPRYYPGQTVAPFSQQTNQALGNYWDQTQNQGQAQALDQQMQGTLGGDYLNSNPYLDQMVQSAMDPVVRNYQEATAPGIQAQFANSGMANSGLYQNAMDQSRDTLGKNLGFMSSNIYGQNYANERQNQMRAAALAPSTIPMNYHGAQQQLNIGNLYDQQRQRGMNANQDRFYFNQNRPYENLGRYQANIAGTYGGQGTQQRPLYEASTGQNILGGAALGGALGNQFGGALGLNGLQGGLAGAGLGALGGWIFG